MKTRFFAAMLAAVALADFALAADLSARVGHEAAERRYAEDRKLCADEPAAAARMQCLRDARAEYDKATTTSGAASERLVDAMPCGGCGRVQSVRLVEQDGEGSAVGMVAGGLAGALLGNQIGKGSGRDIMTIAGAAGGAYAGNKIEQKAKAVRKWEVAVRFDSGEERTYSFDKDPGFSPGAEVKASGGGIIHR